MLYRDKEGKLVVINRLTFSTDNEFYIYIKNF